MKHWKCLMVGLAALMLAAPAFAGEIIEPTMRNDYTKVKELLEKDPKLANYKDDTGDRFLSPGVFGTYHRLYKVTLGNRLCNSRTGLKPE